MDQKPLGKRGGAHPVGRSVPRGERVREYRSCGGGMASLLRHPGLAEALDKSRVGERSDLPGLIRARGPYMTKALPPTAAELAGVGEFSDGPLTLASKGIGRCKVSMNVRSRLIRAARFFEPEDRLVDVR